MVRCPNPECQRTGDRRLYQCGNCGFEGCWTDDGDCCWGTADPCARCSVTGPDSYRYIGTIENENRRMTADGTRRRSEIASVIGITAFRPHNPAAFVSHATLDHPFVEKLAVDLRANGVDAWFSKWEIKAGDSIRGRIEEGIERCEYFIIVLSKNSISRPWVQTELDAATVSKLNGKVKKIIPVKIEDCGDLPPTLGSLCWEDFSSQPYEAAFRRVLNSIFEVDVRPPLGNPPASVRADVHPMGGLAPKDKLILEALCRNTIATGFALIDDITPVVEALRERGISEQQIVEAQDLLEELGYVKLHRVAGPAHPYCQTVTLTGFDTFANANIPGVQNLIATVRQRVRQDDQLENAELAKELGQPLRIVDHILEVMENRGWITLTRESGGGYESLRVDLVSPSLKRTYPQ